MKKINIFNLINGDFGVDDIDTILSSQESLLGYTLINRVCGNVLSHLIKNNVIDSLSDEFSNNLYTIYNTNIIKTRKFKSNIKYISSILHGCDFSYALLKGAYLTTQIYEEGLRTSNDIDILINYTDIMKCQKLLVENGFIQGSYNKINGIVPATREKIIQSRMNYGETIPFIKILDEAPLEVDINFSVDFKPSANKTIVKELLDNTIDIEFEGYIFKTLNDVDFLIHLCCHLYKEATTYNWVVSKRDLTLYKFIDINVFLKKFAGESFYKTLIKKIKLFNVEKECYYTLTNSSIIFPGLRAVTQFENLLIAIKPQNTDFMKQIIWPTKDKIFEYSIDFEDWFFCNNRLEKLKEIIND
ncbi:MAG TPA: nucleotidyltransferase family protein [Candidatus Paceibacterota bacterium]